MPSREENFLSAVKKKDSLQKSKIGSLKLITGLYTVEISILCSNVGKIFCDILVTAIGSGRFLEMTYV